MKFLQVICCVGVLVSLTQACRDDGRSCAPVCGAEIKDPTYQRTFKNIRVLESWNEGAASDEEQFEVIYEGRCEVPDECLDILSPICALPEAGACGEPLCFDNFCELDKYNSENRENEYEYYHDDECNDATVELADDCECLECNLDQWDPVCAIPEDPCGRPVTFASRCWLQKFNCAFPDYQFWYFHEKTCYTDEALD